MPSVVGFPQVNIVETFLERGSVLKLSHGPIFSDFTNKSPVCVKQCRQQSKLKHDVPDLSLFHKDFAESSLQKHEMQSFVPKESQFDTQPVHDKPQKATKAHNSVKCMKADTNCKVEPRAKDQDPRNQNHKTTFTNESRLVRRQRRQRRKPNDVIHEKENSRSQKGKERPPMKAKGTNTEVLPFFTLDPSWPCLMGTSSCKKSKAPVRTAATTSLLQPASSSMVPKAHTKPETYKDHPPNSNSGHFQRRSDHDAELLKELQRDVFEIKAEICKTNSLVRDVEKRLKEASSTPSHDATDKKANSQSSLPTQSGMRWIESVLPPCASPMQTQSFPLFPEKDLLPLTTGESSLISQSLQQNNCYFLQVPSPCIPSLDLNNQDTEKERTSSKVSKQSTTRTSTIQNPRLIDASYSDALSRDQQKNKVLKKTPESLTEDMTLSLHGDDSGINLTQLIREKKDSLRDLALRKGMCAIELKYLTKLKQAKHQFLREFNNQEESALRGIQFSNSHSNSSNMDQLKKIASKNQPPHFAYKRKAIPYSKTKIIASVDGKETSDANVICLGSGEEQSQEKEIVPETAHSVRNEDQIVYESVEPAKSYREDVAPRTPTDDTERCTVSQENTAINAEYTQSKERTLDSPFEAPSSELQSDVVLETGSISTANECDLPASKSKDSVSRDTLDPESEESDADNLLLRVSDLSSDSSIEDHMGQVSSEHSETKIKQPASISSESSIPQKDSIEPNQQMFGPQEIDTQLEGNIDGSSTALSASDEAVQIPVDVVEVTQQNKTSITEESEAVQKEIKKDVASADALSNVPLSISPVESPNEEEIPSQTVNEESSLESADLITTGNTQKLVTEQEESSQQRTNCMLDVVSDKEKSEPTLDLQDQNSKEGEVEVHEIEESMDDHGAQNIEHMEGEFISKGVLFHEDTSSASSVVSESGINFCSSASSSTEPSVEVFDIHDQDPPVQRTLILESTEPINCTENTETRLTNREKELHEMVQEYIAPGKPVLEEPVFCELSEDDSDFEHEDPTITRDELLAAPSLASVTVRDETPALSTLTKRSSITEGIDELVGSCITRFYESGDMDRFFRDEKQDPYCDFPLKLIDLPEGVLFAGNPLNGIKQMLQDQVNTYLLKNRTQIYLASKVTDTLNLPTEEELKIGVTKLVHEVLQMHEVQLEQINSHITEDLESFFNDDLKFHELLVRHLS